MERSDVVEADMGKTGRLEKSRAFFGTLSAGERALRILVCVRGVRVCVLEPAKSTNLDRPWLVSVFLQPSDVGGGERGGGGGRSASKRKSICTPALGQSRNGTHSGGAVSGCLVRLGGPDSTDFTGLCRAPTGQPPARSPRSPARLANGRPASGSHQRVSQRGRRRLGGILVAGLVGSSPQRRAIGSG